MSRTNDLKNIIVSLGNNLYYSNEDAVVALGDSLQLLKKLPDHSVSLILTDPPYHSTKKNNIINDKAFSTDDDFISWMELYALQWKRVLRPNGSIFMFCSSCMESKLDNMLSKYFNILSHIVWTKPNDPGYDGWKGKMKKEALRQWYPHSERIIFMESASDGNLNRSYFGNYLRRLRNKCNLSGKDLTEMIGAYGKVNHGGAVSNWESGRNIPSREQYASICDALRRSGIKEDLLTYEDVIRPFEVNANVEFTDVWNFPSVKTYKGKHPAEKPVNMLEHCINCTTFPGDIVLDCFAGSGSTIIASLKTHRLGIGIEIDEGWCSSIKKNIENMIEAGDEYEDIQALMKKQAVIKEPSLFNFEN